MTPPASPPADILTAPNYFHLGLAVDAEWNNWKTLTTTLDYLVSNRIAQGQTLVIHDVTSWFSTKEALLWAVGKGYRVEYTPRHIHARNHTPISTFWDIHVAKPMDALAAFYNAGKNKTGFKNAADLVKECADIVQQHGIPARSTACNKLPEPHPWPYVLTQSGQARKYGDTYRIGHFYAPGATMQAARTWLWASVEPFSDKFGDYHLENFKVDPEGWWHFNLRRDYVD